MKIKKLGDYDVMLVGTMLIKNWDERAVELSDFISNTD